MIGTRRKQGPNLHMQTITKCLELFENGGPKTHIFLVDSQHMSEMVQRGGKSIEAIGYPALFSRHLAQITLGNNDKKKGLGFMISYIPLSEETLDRIRGREAMVHRLYETTPGHLLENYMQALNAYINTLNAKWEPAQ